MADEIPDGVSLSGSRRTLNESPRREIGPLGDANLFGVGLFAQQHVSWLRAGLRRATGLCRPEHRFLRSVDSHDVEQGPR